MPFDANVAVAAMLPMRYGPMPASRRRPIPMASHPNVMPVAAIPESANPYKPDSRRRTRILVSNFRRSIDYDISLDSVAGPLDHDFTSRRWWRLLLHDDFPARMRLINHRIHFATHYAEP